MSIIQDYIASVAKACPELSAEELSYFAEGISVEQLKAKAYYIQPGELWQKIGYIMEGLVRVYCYNSLGEEVNLMFLDRGDFIAKISVLGQSSPAEFYYQCIEPTTLISIPQAHLAELRTKNPALNSYIISQYEQITLSLRNRLLTHLLNDAEGRYVQFMTEYAELYPRIPATHLCSYLGIKRQHLTRIRKKLLNS